jgi:hypothetical protein
MMYYFVLMLDEGERFTAIDALNGRLCVFRPNNCSNINKKEISKTFKTMVIFKKCYNDYMQTKKHYSNLV